MLHCVEWERRRGSERERGGREGANYSNNNDNIVNLTLIIISINLDQEWGMSKINRKDKLFFTTQKLGSFSFLQHAINPQNHLGHCTWTVFSIHSLITKITNHRWQCWQSYDCTECESPRCAPPLCPPCPPPPCPPPCSRSPGPGPECSRARSRSSRGSSLSSGWGWEQSIWNLNDYGETLSVSLHSHCDDAEAIHGQLCKVQEAVSVQGSEAAALVLAEVARSELVEVPGAGVTVAVDYCALTLARQTQTRALRWQHGDYDQAVSWVSPQHNLPKLLQKTDNKCTFQALYFDKLNLYHSQRKISGRKQVFGWELESSFSPYRCKTFLCLLLLLNLDISVQCLF